MELKVSGNFSPPETYAPDKEHAHDYAGYPFGNDSVRIFRVASTFDLNNRVTLTGTLTKYDWRNPHIELFVEAKGDKDQTETWSVEGPPPVFFRDRDISKSDIEAGVGKTVTVEASRARDGSRWGLLRTLTLPGGKLVSACPQNC